jgi:hypothetical protein
LFFGFWFLFLGFWFFIFGVLVVYFGGSGFLFLGFFFYFWQEQFFCLPKQFRPFLDPTQPRVQLVRPLLPGEYIGRV